MNGVAESLHAAATTAMNQQTLPGWEAFWGMCVTFSLDKCDSRWVLDSNKYAWAAELADVGLGGKGEEFVRLNG